MRAADPDGPPPLARAYRLGPGKVRAVDHEGREFDVTVGTRGPGEPAQVTVTRDGQSLTAPAGTRRGDPTMTARQLAGQLTGERQPGRKRARSRAPASAAGTGRAAEGVADRRARPAGRGTVHEREP